MAITVKHQRPKTAGPGGPVKIAVAVVIGLMLIGLTLFLVIIGPGRGFATGTGLFGTRASLFADINLVAEVLLLLGLTVGYGLARSGNITAHQYNQTLWVLFNIVLLMFIMLVSFSRQVVRGIPDELLRPYYAASFIHSALGGVTILCAIYLLLRMNKLLPKALRISWWKNLMRVTLGLYWLVGLFGLATYYIWYVQPREVSGAPEVGEAPPNTVIVPVANYAFNPGGLEIPAGTTVIFRNDDPDPHTVTSDTGAFAEGILEEGQDYSVTFDEVGEYAYFCLYHGAAGGVGMAGVVRVGEPDAVASLPTAVAPPAPTPQPTPAEPPAAPLGPQAVGFGAFRDEAARSDAFELEVSGLPAVQGDLHAWLTGGSRFTDLGRLAPDEQGRATFTYVSPSGENLVATYSGFYISVEAPGSVPQGPSAQVLLGSSLAPDVLGPVRQLLVESEAPEGTAYAVGLIHLTEELFRHAKAVNGAAVVGDFDGMNRHIEHMLTLIQGQGGEHYRDFDNNGEIQDPGDGYGILRYADAVAAQAQVAAGAPGATDNVRFHAAEAQVLAGNLRDWSAQVVDRVIRAHQATTAAEQQTLTSEALALTRTMLDGSDANRNGLVEAIAGEGGAYTTYFVAQYLAALAAVPEAGSGVATMVPVTETSPLPTASSVPEATTTAPGATVTTAAPATSAPAQATATIAPVLITYRNFEIVPAQTTIQAGTEVIFLIEGGLHQPYAGANAPFIFEAPNNLGNGSRWPHTFNDARTMTILCGYHANMSATLVVEP
jgi:plastocyanin